MLPHVANQFAKGDIKGVRNSLYTSFDFVSSISIPMMFGLMAISKQFAPWFLGSEFKLSGQIMFIESPIIVFIAWSNVTGTQYLMPVNRVKEYTTSVTIGAVSNIIFNFFLISIWGANGAALATVGSEFLVTSSQMMMIRKTISRRKMFHEIWKYFIAGIVMFLVVERVSETIQMSISNLILQVTLGIFMYVTVLFILRANILNKAKDLLSGSKS